MQTINGQSALNHGQTVHHKGAKVQKDGERKHPRYGNRVKSAV